MLVDAIAQLLQDYSRLLLLLSLAATLLGLSSASGLFTKRRQEQLNMNTSKSAMVSDHEKASQVEDDAVVKAEESAAGANKKGRSRTRESGRGPGWLRSLSAGQRLSDGQQELLRRRKPVAADAAAVQEKQVAMSGHVQRKASLTGEEVKEMADAFIARVRNRLRLQRQESYEARLDRSS